MRPPVGAQHALEAYWWRSCGGLDGLDGLGRGLLVSFTEKKEFVVCVGEKGNETTVRTTTYIVRRCNFEMRRLFA
jgi:hypothetical protein